MNPCVVEIAASVKVNGKWFLMGHQFCTNGTAKVEVSCGCGSDNTTLKLHYLVTVDDVTYQIPEEYIAVVNEMKDSSLWDRQAYARLERTGFDETTDFRAQAKELLGIETWRTTADVAVDMDIERKLGYA